MRLAYLSDFDPKGSGYSHISINICKELVHRGHEVHALGINYNGEEHPYPFGIVPISVVDFIRQGMVTAINMKRDDLYDHLLIALDVPAHCKMGGELTKRKIPFSSIFPLEAPPLNVQWSMGLMQAAHRFVISQFGTDACEAVGVSALHLPIPVDVQAWRVATLQERSAIRKTMGISEDAKVVLTVADNQERKNLGATLEIIQRTPDVISIMVTRVNSPMGWALDDYANELGIADRIMLLDRGIEFKRLWSMFAIANAFLITSKAEGLGMPVLEAMACRLPVVAPDHSAFHEHLSSGRGWLFPNAYQYRDVFGNEWRYFADVAAGSLALQSCLNATEEERNYRLSAAQAYVTQRSWETVGDILCTALIS